MPYNRMEAKPRASEHCRFCGDAKGMRKTRSIGQDIERWWEVNEVQIPGTKNAR